MSPSALLRRAAVVVVAAVLASSALFAPSVAWADGDAYKQHWENGLKFFADKNYSAAEAEFQAAYDVRPSARPLFNIAVCDKELFHYAQAIAALEKMLAVHGDGMSADDKKAATDAIRDMRALLGTVTINVVPPTAKVTVDGDEVSIAQPLLLSPGKRVIVAKADGYATTEQTVNVSSGQASVVSFALVAEKGAVTVEAPDPRMSIAVDNQPVGQGRWSGFLVPGEHVVRMYGPDMAPIGTQIVVAAGVSLLVTKDAGGTLLAPVKAQDPPPQRGFYVLGLGGMLLAATHPPNFPAKVNSAGTPITYGSIDLPDYGAAYGLRAGYQVNKYAGFEATFEHSSITTYERDTPNTPNPEYYRIVANRVILGMRLKSPGATVRFVSAFGVGLTYDQMLVNMPGCIVPAVPPATMMTTSTSGACFLLGPTTSLGFSNHTGLDALVLIEAGIELDIDRVLLDFGAELQLQSTGNLQAQNNAAIFGILPLVNAGPAFRFGYRFW